MKEVIMPKFGFTQESGELVRWIKQEGEAVKEGDPIAEVTTDKINMEIEAPASGTLSAISAREGDVIPVTQIIAWILKPGEAAPTGAVPSPAPQAASAETPSPAPLAAVLMATPVAQRAAQDLGVDLQKVRGSGAGGRITREDVENFANSQPSPALPDPRERATPAARRVAREENIGLGDVAGSGPHGRVQAGDVLAAASSAKQAAAPAQKPSAQTEDAFTALPMNAMRRTIAARLQKSAQDAPHVTFDADVDMSALETLRAELNKSAAKDEPKVSVTALLVKACAWALGRHPRINSQLDVDNNRILLMRAINIGMAVALEDGLIVPVIKDAPNKGLRKLAAEIADLGARAKQNKLKMDELSGGTFTISNLGMHEIDRFTAIINPPECAILAVGRAAQKFVPDAEGKPVARPIATLRLSADHRVIDGAVAALFMKDLRKAIENPGVMLS
ncbi:MAG TPA: 2-oxo acid dehydrogenase subunit E2 [Thermoflexales bacterium]|nr:2-oxo acid dehydrogenase subunit E2 [Thermoflexales bacterium]HQW35826.1 2-oxo acid dehydrogenase subunit E2 [Thermoflexales bacterium]HQZ20799.1 2-oxo acid dehydrogenase subunit E2 [Thermoflexales bacterium]